MEWRAQLSHMLSVDTERERFHNVGIYPERASCTWVMALVSAMALASASSSPVAR